MSGVRKPAAPHFYPGNLRGQLESFLADFCLPPDLPTGLTGAILPHAGWAYSGQTAARTLFCLRQQAQPETAIIFGTDHTGVRHHSLYPDGAWSTPLGDANIDRELTKLIIEEFSDLVIADQAAHATEHSIEVVVPMLKYFWPDLQIVPITVRPVENSLELGSGLGRIVKQSNQNVIFIASSDLTHYGSLYGLMPAGSGAPGYQWLCKNDERMIERLCNVDGEEVLREAHEHWNACGAGAVTAFLGAMAVLSREEGILIEYTTSHGSAPESEFTYGVGYAGIVY